jgi:hypothetical protein
MSRPTARIALLLALLACLPAGSVARAQDDPVGQFLPSSDDRDGDGLHDGADCAPDDPTRPARSGSDLDCDGDPDSGGSAGIGIAGPVDGGPDPGPGEQTAASRPSTGTTETKTAARRAAGEAVVAARGLRLGASVAIYAPAASHAFAPALVFVAKGNTGITVVPSLVFAGGETRALKTRRRSVPRGRAWVVRLLLSPSQQPARRVRFAVTVVDGAGESYTATRSVSLR